MNEAEKIKNKISLTETGKSWLEQFSDVDKALATELLDSLVWVSDREFKDKISSKIERVANKYNGPVAMYLEREIRKNAYGVQRFYKQKKSPRRAHGAALQPIESTKRYNDEVGSEGVVGNIATSIRRSNRNKYLFHPTAEDVRKKKVRAFILLTDTIGSGEQISKCLDSLWKVASVKSWKSSRHVKFCIVSYAITSSAQSLLEKHKTNPSLEYIIPCPTIDNQFEDDRKRERIIDLCKTYGKKASKSIKVPALGFSQTGALIAYGHGIPNNSPVIFYKSSTQWSPIFPARVTNSLARELNPGERKVDHKVLLDRWNKRKLAASKWINSGNTDAKNLVTIMASLHRPPRSEVAISARTQLDVDYVEKLLDIAQFHEWVSGSNRLTDEGKLLLKKLERDEKPREIVFKDSNQLYFPSTLRVPY